MNEAKPFSITKKEVWDAYKRGKENKGAAGVDDQTIEDFEKRLSEKSQKTAQPWQFLFDLSSRGRRGDRGSAFPFSSRAGRVCCY
jgi:hypothetical protein